MAELTQAQIDEAVMIAKNATYRLAKELVLEQKYGGNIDCCITKLKLLWNYFRALACHVAYTKSVGTITITGVGNGFRIEIFVDGVSITDGPVSYVGGGVSAMSAAVVLAINKVQIIYVAVYDSDTGIISITSPDCEDHVMTKQTSGQGGASISDFTGGNCANNCLSDEIAKKLITSIKKMCSN